MSALYEKSNLIFRWCEENVYNIHCISDAFHQTDLLRFVRITCICFVHSFGHGFKYEYIDFMLLRFPLFQSYFNRVNANLITLSLLIILAFYRPTHMMPSMYGGDADDDDLTDDYRCADVRCARALGGQSTSHFISDGFVQYSQPSFNGMVELYQSSASINMCS